MPAVWTWPRPACSSWAPSTTWTSSGSGKPGAARRQPRNTPWDLSSPSQLWRWTIAKCPYRHNLEPRSLMMWTSQTSEQSERLPHWHMLCLLNRAYPAAFFCFKFVYFIALGPKDTEQVTINDLFLFHFVCLFQSVIVTSPISPPLFFMFFFVLRGSQRDLLPLFSLMDFWDVSCNTNFS